MILSFETRERMKTKPGRATSEHKQTIEISVECRHSSLHRRENCHPGHSVSVLRAPSTPVDSWTAADLRTVLLEVIGVAGSGYDAESPMGFTFSQTSRADHRGSRGRRVVRELAVDLEEHLMEFGLGGHRVTMKLPGFPHRALAALLAQHSDGPMSLAFEVRPDRLQDEP